MWRDAAVLRRLQARLRCRCWRRATSCWWPAGYCTAGQRTSVRTAARRVAAGARGGAARIRPLCRGAVGRVLRGVLQRGVPAFDREISRFPAVVTQ